MIDKFLDILKDLLPNRDLPTIVWAVRLFSVACIGLIFTLVLNTIIQGTPLGDRMGINRPKPLLPTLTQTELIYSNRESWAELDKFKDINQSEVRASFLVFLVRKKDGNIVNTQTANDKRRYPLIWVWDITQGSNVSLRLIEDSFTPNIDKFVDLFIEHKKKEARYCFFNALPNDTLNILKRAIKGFDANNVVFCAMYNTTDTPIGATISYIKLSPKQPKNFNDDTLYFYMDRLRTVTDTIEPKYSDMSVNYQFVYNSRP